MYIHRLMRFSIKSTHTPIPEQSINKVTELKQNWAARLVMGCSVRYPIIQMHCRLSWLTVEQGLFIQTQSNVLFPQKQGMPVVRTCSLCTKVHFTQKVIHVCQVCECSMYCRACTAFTRFSGCSAQPGYQSWEKASSDWMIRQRKPRDSSHELFPTLIGSYIGILNCALSFTLHQFLRWQCVCSSLCLRVCVCVRVQVILPSPQAVLLPLLYL